MLLAGAQSARAPDRAWFKPEPGLPNEAEVLFYAFLVASIDWSVADLDQWAKKVLLEEARRKSLGPDWTPPADAWWRPSGKKPAAAFEPLRVALQQTRWPKPALDRVGAAMQRWQRSGRCDGLGHSELGRQLRQDDRKVLGPKNAKGRSRPRFEHAVVEVAALVGRRGAELRSEGRSDAPPGLSMQQELVLALAGRAQAQAELEAARQARDRAADGWRKAKARLALREEREQPHGPRLRRRGAALRQPRHRARVSPQPRQRAGRQQQAGEVLVARAAVQRDDGGAARLHALVSGPMRWLTGCSTALHDWGLDNSNEVLDLVYDAMVKVAADGHTLLDPSFDPLESIAAKQPSFAKWRSERLLRTDGAGARRHQALHPCARAC